MDITGIDKALDRLTPGCRRLFDRLFTYDIYCGRLRVPPPMEQWVVSQFGSLEAVTQQKIVRLKNRITGEETIFNPLRIKRPHDTRETECFSLDSLDAAPDSFDTPEKSTSEDTFGRIRGKFCVTASNIAKCDGWHGVVVFREHHPLRFDEEKVIDYLETAWRWAKAAHHQSPENKYFFYSWNCLWRSAASVVHGHNQMMLTRGRHFSRIEHLRKAALSYSRRFGRNYFDDLFKAHECLGLASVYTGIRRMAYLTPLKSNEIVLTSGKFNKPFMRRIYECLAFYRDKLGVESFNLAVTLPPLGITKEDWRGFPVIAWMVDRGQLGNRSSDIGALELFASTSVVTDPYALSDKLGIYEGLQRKRGE
jgi:hypothetical protein